MNELLVSGTENASPIIPSDSSKANNDGEAFAALLDQAGGTEESETTPANEKLDESAPDQDATGLPMRRKLTKEEERRLQWLQDQLQQCLLSLAERPSEQTRQRIRELEQEIAELTGVDMKSSLSRTARTLTELDKDAEDEDEGRGETMSGDMAVELGVRPLPIDRSDGGPDIMNFYQQNLAAFLAVAAQDSGKAVPNHTPLFTTA